MDRMYMYGSLGTKSNSRITKALYALEDSIDEDVAYRDLYEALRKLISLDDDAYTIGAFSEIFTPLNYLLRSKGRAAANMTTTKEQIPVFNINDIAGQRSFLEAKPLISALTEPVENRLEIIREAREKKQFDDFRIYLYLNKALGDEQPEVVELVTDIIRNDLGDEIFPFLLNHFEYNDLDVNLRRFELLCEGKYEELDVLLDNILDSNAIKLQAKAIEYLSTDAAYEDWLIDLIESPQKLLKRSALFGLAKMKTENAEKKLCELYANAVRKKSKGDIELITKVLSQSDLLYTFDEVLLHTREIFNRIIAANKQAEADLFYCLQWAILMLKQKGRAEVYDFFLEILLHKGYNEIVRKKKYVLAKPAQSVSYAIIDAIQIMDAEQLQAFLGKVIREMEESEWKGPFYKLYLKECIRKGDSAEQIYDVFAPHYRDGNISVEDIVEMYCGVDESPEGASGVVDSRWLDQLYETLEHIDEKEHIDALLQALGQLDPEPSNYDQALIRVGRVTKKHLLEITTMIMQRDLPEKYETVYSLVKHCHDQGQSGSYALRQLTKATYWSEFPEAYAEKFRELKNAPKAISAKIAERPVLTTDEQIN
jgi:hypothetical protein